MLNIDVYSTRAVIRSQEPLTVGLVGGEAHFRFSDRWKGLSKDVLFQHNGYTNVVTMFGSSNTVKIPPESLRAPGMPVRIGIFGYDADRKVVIPTVWVETDPVQEAPDPEEDPTTDPTLPVYAQLQAQMEQDKAVLSQKIDQQAADMQQHKIEAETTHTQLRQQLEEADKAVYRPALTWDAEKGVYVCNVSIAEITAAYKRNKSVVCYFGGREMHYVGANKDSFGVNQYYFRGNSSSGSMTHIVRIYAPEGDAAAKAHGVIHSEPVAADLSAYSALGRVGVIGDSLSTGVEDGDTATTEDRNQSWVTWLERATGNPHVHLGYGGATTSGWLRDKLEDALKAENLCDAYILALGFNDCRNWGGNGRAVPLRLNQNGLLDITGSDTWVNAAGETLVYSTYYFNVEKILRKLHEAAPEAPIFVLTNPDYTGDAIANPTAYNQALREIVEVYGEQYNAHLIDLYSLYGSVYQELEQFRGYANHFPRQIYAYMGQIIGTAITRDIVTSPDAYGTLKGCVGMSHYAMLSRHDAALVSQTAAVQKCVNRLENLENELPDVVERVEALEQQSGGADLSGYVKAPATAAAGQVLAVKSVDSSGKPSDWVAVRLSNLGEFDALKNSVSAIDDTIGAGTPLVASAAVGQTVVVKAVDENGVPTEWEAADLESGGGTEKAATLLDVTLESPVERVDCPFAEEHQNLTNFLVLVYPVRDGTYTGTSHTINVFLYWADGTNDKATITSNLNQTANTSAYACNIYYNPELDLYRHGNNIFCERRGVAGSKMTQISLAAAFTEKEFKAGTRIVIKGWRDNL